MILRPARTEDLDRLAEIEAASFGDHRIPRRRLERMLLHASRPLLVADDDADGDNAVDDRERLLGYVSVLTRRGFPEARLFSVAVAPDARGRGVGAALVSAAESAAAALGCSSIRLEVSPGNAAAAALYRAAGYEEIRRWPNWYGKGRAAVVLRKSWGRR